MNLAEFDPLHLYQLVLLCAGVAGLLVGLRRACRLAARFRKVPEVFRQAAILGAGRAARRFARQEWRKLVALAFLVLLLLALTIVTRSI